MATRVSLADLTHTGQVIAANSFPLGMTFIAGYARQELGSEIDVEVFKYPNDFADYCDREMPAIAGFSCFTWNARLHHEYASRIKQVSPRTVTVFGGPHFPDTPAEQLAFLTKFSGIDFFVEFEGERAFIDFFRAMKDVDFDVARFKAERRTTPSLRYVVDGELVRAPLIDKIKDLSILPSPHLSGVSDKFYDDILIPMMQTTRGCPYHCSFCWEGGDFFSKVGRFPQERVRAELAYIAERVGNKVPDLFVIDSNFGIFEQDIDTSKTILEVQARHPNGWPRSVMTSTAKNHKERTMRIVELLGVTLPPTAAIQSTNEVVLDEIMRKNVSLDVLTKMARHTDHHGGQSEAEIILCLPNDTREAHFKSVIDMLDAGMTYIRMYQCMMLPGTSMVSPASREKHRMVTRFRVLPRCFGKYRLGDQHFPVAEIEEIMVANATMPSEAYQDCRDLNLTVEIFSNDSIFADLVHFLNRYGIKRSDWIREVYDGIMREGGTLAGLYRDYREEEKKNLWLDLKEIETFVKKDGVIDRYISAEYGTNELYKYRALAVFFHIDQLHKVAYAAARQQLSRTGHLTADVEHYLDELARFSLLRKNQTLDTAHTTSGRFHYDFPRILEEMFECDPFEYTIPEGIEIEIFHTDQQKSFIEGYINQYTTSLIGLGRILVRANLNRLYRRARPLPASSERAMVH